SPWRVGRQGPLWGAGALGVGGGRGVSGVLGGGGGGQLAPSQTYPRVLNRAVWSSLGASRILFGLLVSTFAPAGPLVVGIDETIERRRGQKIGAAGIYRDPVRSSRSHFVKVRGLRLRSAPRCWYPSRGRDARGRCPSSRCLPPRSVRLPVGDGASSP